ncbi:hypothetical protein BT69DRAFT_1343241 [Atractiella rhizophila]|nr:hypothetical protein BT69DRAFT_1343241 [Atractiella rhizophila]
MKANIKGLSAVLLPLHPPDRPPFRPDHESGGKRVDLRLGPEMGHDVSMGYLRKSYRPDISPPMQARMKFFALVALLAAFVSASPSSENLAERQTIGDGCPTEW